MSWQSEAFKTYEDFAHLRTRHEMQNTRPHHCREAPRSERHGVTEFGQCLRFCVVLHDDSACVVSRVALCRGTPIHTFGLKDLISGNGTVSFHAFDVSWHGQRVDPKNATVLATVWPGKPLAHG